MNLLKQSFQKNKSSFLFLITLSVFTFFFFYSNKDFLSQTFDSGSVNRYLRSQDILDKENVIKDRIFVSDEEIYIASGFLYANGASPTEYNFQHPPFIKYLFGLSAKYFNLPLLPNIFFAELLLLEVFLLGKLIFKSEIVGLLSSLLLLFDPVFKEVTTYALLDLGQMVFLLGFILTSFFWKRHWIGRGVLLGLAFSSKFYSPVIIFLGVIYLYKIITKEFDISRACNLVAKREIMMLFVALVTFASTYVISFMNGDFNFLFHQLKIVKFMLDHNKAVEWGGVISIFFGGYVLWPILFFVNLFAILNTKFQDLRFLFCLIPISYFLILNFQLPFTRYLILILPFLYLSFANFLISKNPH